MATGQQADVMASAVAGDEIAFRRIIAAHHAEMRRVCAYIAGDLSIADEAVQAAWVVAWKRLRDVSEPNHLRPWLVRVAANEAKQLLRRRSTRAKFEVATTASQEPGGRDPATGVTGLFQAGLIPHRQLLSARTGGAAAGAFPWPLEREQQQERNQQREDAERLGDGEAEDQVAKLALRGRRVAHRGGKVVAEDDAHADTGAAHADTGDTCADVFRSHWIHNRLLLVLAFNSGSGRQWPG